MSTRLRNQASVALAAESGFALLEMVIALVIMALVGLMAWQGMDAMIRGRETIDRRANLDASYSQLVRQFERDCQEILRREEIAPLFSGANASAGNTSAITSLVAGSKNIWWMRRYRADAQDAWMIVGYGMSSTGLQRLTSRPLLRRSEAGALWAGISRDPDLISSEFLVSLELSNVVRQSFQVQTSAISGAGGNGISATGTGSPAANTSSALSAASAPTSDTPVSNIYPDNQGVVMQWWTRGVSLPMTRSCLMGPSL